MEYEICLKNAIIILTRSFSAEKNQDLGCPEDIKKMYPLRLNYMVSCGDSPYSKSKPGIKNVLFRLRGDKSSTYFTCEKFEAPIYFKDNSMRIIFFTRLWDDKDDINSTRIQIIRELKKVYEKQFQGGICDSKLAREMAPDLIISKNLTERSNYLNMVKESDICIATTGLHDSIG